MDTDNRPMWLPETDGIDYPSGDGQPLAETMTHLHALIFVYFQLTQWAILRERPDALTLVDNFWFYERGQPSVRVAPDVFTMFGVENATMERPSWHEWREGGIRPIAIFEMASKSTWRDNVGAKKDLYEKLGVGEYFVYDPKAEFLDEFVLGWRLEEGQYVEIEPDATGRLHSLALDVWMASEDQFLRLFDGPTGEAIRIPSEQFRSERDIARLQKTRAEEHSELLAEERDEARHELGEARQGRQQAEARNAELGLEIGEARHELGEAWHELGETRRVARDAIDDKDRMQLELEVEKSRSEAMRERLRELGIDPDTVM